MVRHLTFTEAVVALLLIAALIWVAVQLGPIALERWF
jgi:hypothetical protein